MTQIRFLPSRGFILLHWTVCRWGRPVRNTLLGEVILLSLVNRKKYSLASIKQTKPRVAQNTANVQVHQEPEAVCTFPSFQTSTIVGVIIIVLVAISLFGSAGPTTTVFSLKVRLEIKKTNCLYLFSTLLNCSSPSERET